VDYFVTECPNVLMSCHIILTNIPSKIRVADLFSCMEYDWYSKTYLI